MVPFSKWSNHRAINNQLVNTGMDLDRTSQILGISRHACCSSRLVHHSFCSQFMYHNLWGDLCRRVVVSIVSKFCSTTVFPFQYSIIEHWTENNAWGDFLWTKNQIIRESELVHTITKYAIIIKGQYWVNFWASVTWPRRKSHILGHQRQFQI